LLIRGTSSNKMPRCWTKKTPSNTIFNV
jgi:hypothetical protein